MPVLITNCSNNYGTYHFPEKLIPVTIINALHGKSLPIYGDGSHIRDWLYVDDHRMHFCWLQKKVKLEEAIILEGKRDYEFKSGKENMQYFSIGYLLLKGSYADK